MKQVHTAEVHAQMPGHDVKEDLRRLTFELDGVIGTICRLVESLNDVRSELNFLRQSMDDAAHHGQERLYFREHHKKVRLLDDLMYYLMNDLSPVGDKAYELHASIFELVRKIGETGIDSKPGAGGVSK